MRAATDPKPAERNRSILRALQWLKREKVKFLTLFVKNRTPAPLTEIAQFETLEVYEILNPGKKT